MTQQSKSPFLVFQSVLDNATCDKIADAVHVQPTVSDDGIPQAMERHHHESESIIFSVIKNLIPQIESHFVGFKYRGTEDMIFQQFPVSNGNVAEMPRCDNAVYKRKKWIRIRERDLTGILWLKDYKDDPPFDGRRNVYGGKLEFPVYNFGLQPQKGTFVIYPACQRFIYHTSPILVGELQCVRIFMCGQGLWVYDPTEYPGDFRTWFSDIV